ncbi:MAG: class I SAM-dependent RNA methyltransferase [Deltaproteobacteria bacterium]|nr:class I SAM-dependent RNA methyltransferase [Deltaproteobacteria bacterium]
MVSVSMSSSSLQVKIDNLTFGGDFIGNVNFSADQSLLGIKAFVPYCLPGEEVKVEIVEKKSQFLKTRLLEVITPAADREQPLCSHFMLCGGCELQQMKYQAQLRAKQEMILNALRGLPYLKNVETLLQPLAASSPYRYRLRAVFHGNQDGQIGFFKPQTHDVVSIEECHILTEKLASLVPRLKEFGTMVCALAFSLNLAEDEQGVIAVIEGQEIKTKEDLTKIAEAADRLFVNYIVKQNGKELLVKGRNELSYSLQKNSELKLIVPAGGFSQVNWQVNQLLIEKVVEECLADRGKTVLDLYAGAGNFTLPLAQAGFFVTAVECDARLVNLGKKNISKNNLADKIKYFGQSVEVFLKQSNACKTSDIVILDPPRSGLQKTAEAINFGKKLILLSCYFPSFINDLKALQRYGWQVKQIAPFDMFPQTSLVEIMTVLTR